MKQNTKKILGLIGGIILALVLCFICFFIVMKMLKKAPKTPTENETKIENQEQEVATDKNYELFVYNQSENKTYFYGLDGKPIGNDQAVSGSKDVRIIDNGKKLQYFADTPDGGSAGKYSYDNKETKVSVKRRFKKITENGKDTASSELEVTINGKTSKIDVRANVLDVFETDKDVFVITDFGKGLRSSTMVTVNKSTGQVTEITDVILNNPRLLGIANGVAYLEGDGVLKEYNLEEKKFTRTSKVPEGTQVVAFKDGYYIKDKDMMYFIKRNEMSENLQDIKDNKSFEFKVSNGNFVGLLER